MSDPEYPNEDCVKALRSTVAVVLKEQPSPQDLGDSIVSALHAISDAGTRHDWRTVAANAGTIASMALVLQLDAMARMQPRGPQH
jgi:hypothetical protein